MNPVLAHCGKCYNIPGPGNASQFFLTGCGQVYCQKCLGPQGICKKCGKNCARRSISNSTVGHLFQNPSSLISRLQQAISFQTTRYKAYFNYSNARHASLMKALKERDSKIANLKKQFEENRSVIKELTKQQQKQQQQTSFQATSNHANISINANNSTRTSNQSPYGIFPSNTYRRNPSSTQQRHYQNNISTDQLYQSTPLPGRNRPSLKNFVPTREKSISMIAYNRR